MSTEILAARALANQAGRGSKSDLAALLKALAEGTVYESYAGTPVGNVTPSAIGQKLLDTSNNAWYMATGTTSADWAPLGSAADVVLKSTTTVSTAELEALAATPKELVAAPGAGLALFVQSWRVRAIFAATGMDDAAADGDLVVQWGSDVTIDTMEADGLVDATATTSGVSAPLTEVITAESNITNQALELTNDGAEFTSTGGDTTLEVVVRYRVESIDPS